MRQSPDTQKHTPGPWKAVNAGSHWNNPTITNWQIHWSDAGECVVDHVYEEADAHLIAAAPELLEALQSMLNWMREAEEETGKPIGVGYRANMHKPVIIEKVRSAIAKAEGREVPCA